MHHGNSPLYNPLSDSNRGTEPELMIANDYGYSLEQKNRHLSHAGYGNHGHVVVRMPNCEQRLWSTMGAHVSRTCAHC